MIFSANDIQITSYNYGTYRSQPYPDKQGISGQNDRGNPSQPSENVENSERGKELDPKDKKTKISGEKELTREEEKTVYELRKRQRSKGPRDGTRGSRGWRRQG